MTSSRSIPLEMPVFSPASALQAQALGASRVELNARASYSQGGLTPRLEDVKKTSSLGLQIPNRVMVRPRGPPATGVDFIYSDAEFESMLRDVTALAKGDVLSSARSDGLVFGILKDGLHGVEVDVARNQQLVEAATAGRLKCTFHRAFDELLVASQDVNQVSEKTGSLSVPERVAKAVEDVAACGFDAVLTSGGPGRAQDNVNVLSMVLEQAKGRFQVIIGGGVRSTNVRSIMTKLRLTSGNGAEPWAHSSCLRPERGEQVDETEVKDILEALKAQDSIGH